MHINSVNNGEPIECIYTSDSESGAKRKRSPLKYDYPLKRQVSFDDIYNLNQKVAANKKTDKKFKGKPASFSDMMSHSFQDPSFKESFTPFLAEMARPLIQETVKSAVEGMRSTVVADMIKSNKTLGTIPYY